MTGETRSSLTLLLFCLFGIAALMLAFGGYWFYDRQQQSILDAHYNELKAVAELKVRQIVDWQKERVADALLNASGIIRLYVLQWLQPDSDDTLKPRILVRLQDYRELQGYQNMILAGVDGQLLLSVDPRLSALHPYTEHSVTEAISSRNVAFGDFFRCPVCGDVHLDVAAPILDVEGRPLAVLIQRSDPNQILYPLIESWPNPSSSAETLIVRREENDVLFLNSLRHRSDPPLTLRIPLSQTELPAVQAALGRTGRIEGLDYRGVEVLADIRPVPYSPWIMIAKVDLDEVLAEARYRGRLVGLLTLAFILSVGLGMGFLYKHKTKRTFQALYRSERERREAQEEIRATLYGIGDGVIATDASGCITRMNPVAEALTGWLEKEALGIALSQVFRIISEETRSSVDDPVMRVLREGAVVGLANHTLLIARDGSERPIADSGAPILNEKGQITGVVLVFRDQTEERKHLGALIESENRFRQISSTISDLAYSCIKVRGEAYTIDWMVGAAEQISGYSIDEIKSLRCWRFLVTDEDLPLFDQHVIGLTPGSTGSCDLRIRHKSGKTVWVASISECVSLPNDPERSILYGALMDITERKEAEEALRDSERWIKSIFRAAPTGIGVVKERVIVDANPRLCEMTAYSQEELIGASARMLYPTQEDFDYVGKEKYEQIARQGTGTVETRWMRKDGAIIDVLLSSTPFDLHDLLRGVTFTATDITVQKTLEDHLRQAQKLESIGRLAGGVAHDFNNMLGVILGHAEIAALAVDTSVPIHGNLQEIIKACQRSAEFVRKLLGFARKQTVDPKVLNLNNDVPGMLQMLHRLMGEEIDLVWMPGRDLWHVRIDPSQLDQLLANLAVNARDAIAGIGKVSIETENVLIDEIYCADIAEATAGEYVRLAFSDDGCGMNRETLANIFEPFFTTKGVGHGTGLGLSTVYGIVKQNDGFINVYSEPGEGTTFMIYFPRFVGASAELPHQELVTSVPRGNETVILVEDEGAILELGQIILEGLGYTVVAARTPAEALRVAAEHSGPIDLLITDVVMPEMNGRELAEQLSTARPRMRRLYMSGYTSDIISHRGVLDEGVNFIQKPFSMRGLAEKVRAALDT